MANKNKNVIIALFPSADKADMAANQLKDWDKANDDIKLGGVGILQLDDKGEIQIRKVGARATGTGAKAGMTLGVIAGVLSGGVTLVGGAIAGLVGGSILGALRKKGLHLTDDDIANLKKELQGGKSALVAMADDMEVGPTKAEIEHLGGMVATYALPAEAVDVVEQVAAAASTGDAASDAAAAIDTAKS